MTKINLKIVCGCNSNKTPAIFNNLSDAEAHARSNNHNLVITGSITNIPDWVSTGTK